MATPGYTPYTGPTSYASRSAQAYSGGQQGQGQNQAQYQTQPTSQPVYQGGDQHPQQQPPPTVTNNSTSNGGQSTMVMPQQRPPPSMAPPPPQPQPQVQPQVQSNMNGRYHPNTFFNNSNNQINMALQKEAEEQKRILSEATARVQESSHYMRQAMEMEDLSLVLEKATIMLTELGDPKHHHHHHGHSTAYGGSKQAPTLLHGTSTVLSPKNYYELHTLVVQELPNLEEFLISLCDTNNNPEQQQQNPNRSHLYTPFQLYELVQYCPKAVPRLYLQICVASVWIRLERETVDMTWLLRDLKEGVRCVQCPIRGLFLRNYLLHSLREKLPDEKEEEEEELVHQEETKQEEVQKVLEEEERHVGPAPVVGQEEEVIGLGDLVGDDSGGSNNFLDQMDTIAINDPEPSVERPSATPQTNSNTVNNTINNNATNNNFTVPKSSTVETSYEFILSNLIEMNKLWVRIQHMPGDQKTKEARKKRERERNELRVLVGTNIVRLSELEGVTSAVYGTIILPRILDQIVACRDPLAQAYLMDCIISVFPDEFHIQTLEVLLGICPKLRDKVNVRTILQSLMDRLSNYYDDETLMNDEEDTEGVKMSVMLDAFEIFENCIKSVLDAKGFNVTAREVIRLEASLLGFSLKCYPGRFDHLNQCLNVCASTLRGGDIVDMNGVQVQAKPLHLDLVAFNELEKLLSTPLESLGIDVLELGQYANLMSLLPLDYRKTIGVKMLQAVDVSNTEVQMDLPRLEQLFNIISPLLLRNEHSNNNDESKPHDEQILISKLFHNVYHEDTDVNFEMLIAIRKHLLLCEEGGTSGSTAHTIPSLIYATLKLLNRIRADEFAPTPPPPLIPGQNEISEEPEVIEEPTTTKVEKSEELNGIKDDVNADEVKESEEVEKVEEPEEIDEQVSYTSSNKDADVDNIDDDLSFGTSSNSLNGSDEEQKSSEPMGREVTGVHEKEETNEESDMDNMKDRPEMAPENRNEEVVENEDPAKELAAMEYLEEHMKNSSLEPSVPAVPVFSKQTNCRKVFLFLQKLLSTLRQSDPELCLDMTLQVASVSDACESLAKQYEKKSDLNTVTYEFMTQALLIFESEVSESKAQLKAITAVIGTLLTIVSLDKIDYEALSTKTTQFAARLLKKTDQCKMVLLCSHLFYRSDESAYQNPQRSLECLQRGLKLADACTKASASNLYLFIDILDQYIYFFEKNNPVITDKFISGLIALVNQHLGSSHVANAPGIGEARSHFVRLIDYIEQKRVNNDDSSARFGTIVCKYPN